MMVFVGLGLSIGSYARQEHSTMEVMAVEVQVAVVEVVAVEVADIVAVVEVVGD